jgi:hypothetical protein
MKSLTPEAMRAKRKVVAKRMADAADRARRGEPRYKLEPVKRERKYMRTLKGGHEKVWAQVSYHFRESANHAFTPEGLHAMQNKVSRFYGLNNKYNADGSLKAGR